MTNKQVDPKQIRALYTSSPSNKAALDWFASRERNSREMTVDRLRNKLRYSGTEISRPDVIELFRGLEAAGCGEFVVGRHQHPSRFVWSVSLVSVGQAAAGKSTTVEAILPTEELEPASESRNGESVEHLFNLRADTRVRLSLPRDFTKTEANRLADFVRTLPFE